MPSVTGKVYNHSKRMKEKRAVLDGVAAELRRIIGKPAVKTVEWIRCGSPPDQRQSRNCGCEQPGQREAGRAFSFGRAFRHALCYDHWMMNLTSPILLALMTLAIMTGATSAQQRTFYDARGSVVGRSATDGNGTVTTYDARGKAIRRETAAPKTGATPTKRMRMTATAGPL